MTLSLALDILHYGVPLSLVCAGAGLVFAFVLIAIVIRSSPGNERMRQISGAIQEGAKAYLNRQIITISMIATIIFLLLFFFKDHPTAIGFVIGAFCSLAAGYIGMRIAVLANTRTTEAAANRSRTAALRMAFNGGDCTRMAADVVETYAVSLIGAILVSALSGASTPGTIVYPFVLGGVSVLGDVCGIRFVNFGGGNPAGVLMRAVGMSALVSA